MSKKTTPTSLKAGVNMYWQNMWDDRINFTKKLKEDIFVNMFFLLILKKTSFTIFKNYWKLFFLQKKIPLNKLKKLIILKKKKRIIFYVGKFWFLKFNKWVIILFFIYSPYLWKKNKLKFNFSGNKKSVNFSKNRINYYSNIQIKLYLLNMFNFLQKNSILLLEKEKIIL